MSLAFRKLKPLAAFMVSLAVGFLPPAPAAEPAVKAKGKGKPDNYALIVGINDYPDQPLTGCEGDADDIKSLLVGTLNFPDDAEHVRVLKSKEATKKGIMDAFRKHLVENARKHPDGMFFFHYSGHGSRVRDLSGDEADGMDETLVPVDVTDRPDSHLIDDEMQAMLKELTAHTANVFLVLDCCHSGSNTRAPEYRVRRYEVRGEAAEPGQGARGLLGKKPDTKSTMLASGDRYVVLTGCSPDEVSLELPFRGRQHGLLTYVLIDALRTAQPYVTYRDLWERVKAGVNSIEKKQNPTCEGDLNRRLFAGSADRLPAYMKVKAVNARRVTVDAGVSLGVLPGGQVAFYKPTAKKLIGNDELLADGVVEAVRDFDAIVDLTKPVAASDIEGARAVLVTPFFGLTKVRVAADKSVSGNQGLTDVLKRFVDGLSAKPEIEFLGDIENPFGPRKKAPTDAWNYVVTAATGKDFERWGGNLGGASQRLKDTTGLYVAGASGQPLFNLFVSSDDKDAAVRLAEAIEKRHRQDVVRTLVNDQSPLNDSVDIFIERGKFGGGKWLSDGNALKIDGRRLAFKNDDQFKIRIQNRADRAVHVAIVNLNAKGGIEVVYPPRGAETIDKIAPGATLTLPNAMTVRGEAGIETLKFIVTTSPIDVHRLSQEGVKPDALQSFLASKQGKTRGIDDASGLIPMMLKGMYSPDSSSRGVTYNAAPLPHTWSTQQFDFQVTQ